MRYFSMFSGVGGFEYGIEQAVGDKDRGEQPREEREHKRDDVHPESGSEAVCVGYSEIDRHAISVYRKHYPDHVNFGDATKIDASRIPDFDLLVGGFPCQAFSIAGKRRGFEDTRGTLFFEIARVLRAKRPPYLLLENVKGLLNHDKGETFRTILQTLAELGYDTQWMVLNSKFFGVPQNRERVFFVGNIRGKPRPEILPFGEDLREADEVREGEGTQANAVVSTYARNQSDGQYVIKRHRADEIRNHGQTSPTITESYEHKGGPNMRMIIEDFYPDRIREFAESPTLRGDRTGLKVQTFTVSSSGRGYIEPGRMRIRRLTPVECERLQAFPDGWTAEGVDEKGNTVKISDTQRYKMMGNALTTNVVTAIIKRKVMK